MDERTIILVHNVSKNRTATRLPGVPNADDLIVHHNAYFEVVEVRRKKTPVEVVVRDVSKS